MIETTTNRPIKTDSSNQVQSDRNKGPQSFQSKQFQNAGSKNPAHDGCNVKPEQLQNNRAETSEVDSVNNIDAASEQSGGVEKASGGNCPGSAMIANILQDLFEALEATRIGR